MSSLGSDRNTALRCSSPASYKVSRNFGENRVIVAVFLDATRAFDTAWVDGFLYKLRVLNFPSYLFKTVSSYMSSRTFEFSFQTATSAYCHTRADVAQGEIISPALFSLQVSDIFSPSRHVELALYGDDTAVIVTSQRPALLIIYLEIYLSDLERWLKKWRITIDVSQSSVMLFAKADRRISKPPPAQLFGEPIQWVYTARYLGIPLINGLPGRIISIR